MEYTRSFVFIHCFTFERGRPTINRFFRNSKLNKADVLLQVIYYCDVYYFFINSFISYTPTLSWEGLAADRTGWRSALMQHLKTGEDKLMTAAADKRARRKEGSSSIRPDTTHICVTCNKDCHSHFSVIGDAATTQQQINKIKKQTLGCIIHGHLWPTEASISVFYMTQNMWTKYCPCNVAEQLPEKLMYKILYTFWPIVLYPVCMTCRTDGTGSLHQFLQGYDVDSNNSQEGWCVFISRLQGGYLTATIVPSSGWSWSKRWIWDSTQSVIHGIISICFI